jgi:two-component system sensor histidine kinase DegS
MTKAYQSIVNRLIEKTRKLGFWIIIALFVLITIAHYTEILGYSESFARILNLGITRHAFERVLYLVPIVWSSFLFGFRGVFISTFLALCCMLPRAIFISDYPRDALIETGSVTIVGSLISSLVAFSVKSLRREEEYLTELEAAHRELTKSEEKYRQLFENAHDAICVQDNDGNILAANYALVRLTGYDIESLVHMKVTDFLSKEGLEIAREVRQKLLKGEDFSGTYDQDITRKDGTQAFLRLSTSLVLNEGKPVAFQHIIRDVTEERKMQENLHFYLQQTTKAQEEERKRISRELHDDTIQALVVLSRQLDNLASEDIGLPEKHILHLEELRQRTNDIMQGVRRLSQDLRPAALDRLGLPSALEWLASDVAEYSGLDIKVNVSGRERRFTEEVELILFRIVQEALRNVWRHSQATKANIAVEFNESNIKIIIDDNGRGFSPPKSMGDLAKDGRLGLAGMQERASLVNGTLILQSKPGTGTTVTIEAPI